MVSIQNTGLNVLCCPTIPQFFEFEWFTKPCFSRALLFYKQKVSQTTENVCDIQPFPFLMGCVVVWKNVFLWFAALNG